jgi:2-oxoisovalerate dehydrogenase E1 component
MLILIRQGKVSKWFSGIGQRHIRCNCRFRQDEYILLIRKFGVLQEEIPLPLIPQWQGKANGF